MGTEGKGGEDSYIQKRKTLKNNKKKLISLFLKRE
jgi:hypothetical protein